MKPNMSSIGPKLAGIFEKYCQWMALSLGILWIMYTTYAYWVSKPVAVTVGSEILSPREVDDHVATSVALTKLHDQIDPKLTRIQPDITSVTRGNVPKYAEIILENLSGTKIAGNFNPATSADVKEYVQGLEDRARKERKRKPYSRLTATATLFAGLLLCLGIGLLIGTQVHFAAQLMPDRFFAAIQLPEFLEFVFYPPIVTLLVDLMHTFASSLER